MRLTSELFFPAANNYKNLCYLHRVKVLKILRTVVLALVNLIFEKRKKKTIFRFEIY